MDRPESAASRSRLGTFLVCTLFTLAVGVFFRNSLLVALAEAMAGLVVLLWAGCRAALGALDVRRRLGLRAFEDEEITVVLELTHAGRVPAYLVEVHDQFGADAAPARSAVLQWLPGGRDAVRYEGRCSRGRGSWPLGPIELAVSDPLGLFRLTRRVSTEERLVVYPRPWPRMPEELESPLARAFSGTREAARPGQTANFFGLREQRGGEPLRRVHWRASARRRRILLTEFEAPTHTEVALFLDLERAGLRGVGRGSNVEIAIRVAAAVARRALQGGHSFKLIADDGRPVVLPPRPGRAQLLSVLEALAHMEPAGTRSYLELLERATPLVPEGARAVLLFNRPRIEADRFVDVWARWRRRGVRVSAAVVDELGRPPIEGWETPGERIEPLLDRLGIPYAAVGGREAAAA